MDTDQTLRELLLDPALQEPAARAKPRADTLPSLVTSRSRSDQPESCIEPPHGRDDILNDYDLAVERAQTWTGVARFGFNAMLASTEYKNKLRLSPEKLERITYFLTTPNAKSREKDRADAQIKHQSRQWSYDNGALYRKDSPLRPLRRHVAAEEVFDILTAEHLRSGHHGRDKLLKLLEVKYIGYTKDELMYVIDHCLVCSSKHIRGAAARRREKKTAIDIENGDVEPGSEQMTSTGINHTSQRLLHD